MSNRTGQALGNARKLLLAGAAAAALAGPILIGVGHAPSIHAQPAAAPVVAAAPTDPAPPPPAPTAEPPQAAPAQPETRFRDRKLVVILFDFTGMTPDEQSRARQAAISTIRTQGSNTATAILWVDGGAVKVGADFSSDPAALESTIMGLTPSTTGDAGSRLAHLAAAVKFLGALPGKKALMYFTSPLPHDRAEVEKVLTSAQAASVAFYQIAVSPQPPASFEGQPEVAAALVDALNRETRQSAPSSTATPGLPAGHASIQVFAQRDRFASEHRHVDLVVPLGSLAGTIDILGEIVAASGDTPQNNVRDAVEASPGDWRAGFMLDPAAYTCRLIVRERSTGRTYGETISFTVN